MALNDRFEATSADLASSIEHPYGTPEAFEVFDCSVPGAPTGSRAFQFAGEELVWLAPVRMRLRFLRALKGPIWRTSRSGVGSHGSKMALF